MECHFVRKLKYFSASFAVDFFCARFVYLAHFIFAALTVHCSSPLFLYWLCVNAFNQNFILNIDIHCLSLNWLHVTPTYFTSCFMNSYFVYTSHNLDNERRRAAYHACTAHTTCTRCRKLFGNLNINRRFNKWISLFN